MRDRSAIAARHAEDEAAGPFVGRRSEQARLDRATLLQEIARLREERRWIPVGERLPYHDEWVDVAGWWGDSVGWYEHSGWRNVEEDPFPSEVTHWRKRPPGPEANG